MTDKGFSEDYFDDVDDDMLGYLTDEGLKNIELFTDIYRTNRERAIRLATLLAGGSGACIALAQGSDCFIWLVCLAVAWGLCALILSITCIRTKPRGMQYADPYSLFTNEPDLYLLKRKRLYDYTLVFRQVQSLGKSSGEWFNRMLIWSVVSPLIVSVALVMRCLVPVVS